MRGRKVVRVEDPCPRHGEGSEEVAAGLVPPNLGRRGRTWRRRGQGREEAAPARRVAGTVRSGLTGPVDGSGGGGRGPKSKEPVRVSVCG